MNQRWEGRAPHNFQFDKVFTRNMKFSILTLTALCRKATQGCVPCSHEVCTSDLNACPDTNPFVCLDVAMPKVVVLPLDQFGGMPRAVTNAATFRVVRRRNQRRNPKAVDRACSKFALPTWMIALTPTHLPVSMARQRVAPLPLNTFGWTPRFVTSAATFRIVHQGRARHQKSTQPPTDALTKYYPPR
jgi:hypothetical protein